MLRGDVEVYKMMDKVNSQSFHYKLKVRGAGVGGGPGTKSSLGG